MIDNSLLEQYDKVRMELLQLKQSDVWIQITSKEQEMKMLEDTIKESIKSWEDMDWTPLFEFKKSFVSTYDAKKLVDIIGKEAAATYITEKVEYEFDSKKFEKDLKDKVLPPEAFWVKWQWTMRITIKERSASDITL